MNAQNLLITAAEAANADLNLVGGKGHQLGQLQRYGLPVPDFLVVPATWSEAAGTAFPEALRAMLDSALAARGWLDVPLAVRSSAVGEDAANVSFAGIYRSCLNVSGLPAVMAAIQAVWASRNTPAAIAYQARMGMTGQPPMAAIIMPLLNAQAAGIAFTCDPASGREDRMVIHANWGLGESLVSGKAAGDEYLLAEDSTDTWRLIETRPGSKACWTLTVPEGGTRTEPLAPDRAGQQVLMPAAVETLAALLRDAAVALDFVAPFYDLEWVWDGASFWLTQARRVTRRPHHTYPALQGQPVIWTRGNTCEVMPEPLSPMDWAFSRRAVNDLLEPGWKLAGHALLPGAQRAGLIEGRLYLEATLLQWEAWDAIGLSPEKLNAMMGGHQPAIQVTPPTWHDRLRRLGNTLRYVVRAPAMRQQGEVEIRRIRALLREIDTAPVPETAAALEALLCRLAVLGREAHGLHFLQGAGGGSLSLMLDTLARIFPDESEALGAALLAGGEPSETAQQGYALLELAQLAKIQMQAVPGADIRTLPDESPLFAAALARFLARYGHRGHYETYLRNPRWREKVVLLLEQLPALAEVDLAALQHRQQAAATAAWQRIARSAPWWARRLLPGQVRAANRDCNLREAARSTLIAIAATARRLWLAVGDNMVSAGFFRDREEIFLLLPGEALRIAHGEILPAGIRARLDDRAACFCRWQETTPEEWLCLSADGQRQSAATFARPVQAAAPAPSGPLADGKGWRGVATGTGTVRGKVRRLRHPAEGLALQPGEILVAPSTDPGWTPLFLKAGGLVVETGGYLSHGAIVAREFALPAVVNLPGIFAQLQDGERIEVDGMTGTVRRLPQ